MLSFIEEQNVCWIHDQDQHHTKTHSIKDRVKIKNASRHHKSFKISFSYK